MKDNRTSFCLGEEAGVVAEVVDSEDKQGEVASGSPDNFPVPAVDLALRDARGSCSYCFAGYGRCRVSAKVTRMLTISECWRRK